MVFEDSEPELIDSSGEKYFAGWDDHGWFTIVEAKESEESGEYEPCFKYDKVVSIPPEDAEQVASLIVEEL